MYRSSGSSYLTGELSQNTFPKPREGENRKNGIKREVEIRYQK